jgi:hypothetical protein
MDRLATALADRYRIVREVGAGGMATVYLADDIRHGRQVALKVLRPELAATMGPERFFREIHVAARLQHPHILPLHDSGEADGFLFFVMPFVTGESLRERLDRVAELPVPDVVRILSEVADALSYSHSQGVVHRDIKPDNVMLSGRHAVVTDFGVAKAVSDAKSNSTVTTAGVALGTPTYMAPEQAAADPQLDHRVDIYALGVMGYEMLAGRPPFTGMPPQQMLLAHVTQAPEPVRTHRPACPADLEAVIMRCLAKRAADRFQSAEEIVEALEPLSVSSGGITPTQTRPTPAVVGKPVPAPRPVPPAAAWIGIGVAIAASLVAVFVSTADRESAPATAIERVQLTASGGATAPSLSPDGQRFVFGERNCSDQSLCTIDLRVQDVNGAGSNTLLTKMATLVHTDWSRDGRWLTFMGTVNDRFGAYVMPSLGGTPRFSGCCALTHSFDGRMGLVIGPPSAASEPQVLRWLNLEDGVQRDSLVLPTGNLASAVFEVDNGRKLAALSIFGTSLALMSRNGAVLDSIVPPDGHYFHLPIRAMDGALLVSLGTQVTESHDIVRVAIGEKFGTPTTVSRRMRATHISYTGQVVVSEGSREYALWALERPSLASFTFAARRVAQSTAPLTGSIMASGESLLVAQTRPTDQNIYDYSLIPFNGGNARSLGSHRGVIDWDFQQDNRGLLVVRSAGRQAEVSRLDLGNNQLSVAATVPIERGSIETVPGGGFVQPGAVSQVYTHGIPNRSDTIFVIPNSVGVLAVEPSPDGREAIVGSFDVTGQQIVLSRLSLTDGRVTELTRMRAEGLDAITWLPDNTLLFGVAETQWTQAWYVLPANGGEPRRQTFKLSSNASHRFARSGLRGVAREQIIRADIYLLRGLNVMSPP